MVVFLAVLQIHRRVHAADERVSIIVSLISLEVVQLAVGEEELGRVGAMIFEVPGNGKGQSQLPHAQNWLPRVPYTAVSTLPIRLFSFAGFQMAVYFI